MKKERKSRQYLKREISELRKARDYFKKNADDYFESRNEYFEKYLKESDGNLAKAFIISVLSVFLIASILLHYT
jgi:hypothetical protein